MSNKSLKEALAHRRSYYAISNESPISEGELKELIEFTIKTTPSAFNSQSTRIVLLLGNQHKKLWEIVKETLKAITSPETFINSEKKIDQSFAAGYGTILFFEDESIVHHLQETFPTYQDKFPIWSQQTSAMHQLTIWTLLEDTGFGASLQHYNPLIDEPIHLQWAIPAHWKLIAQMPFGTPLQTPPKKEILPLENRIKIFK